MYAIVVNILEILGPVLGAYIIARLAVKYFKQPVQDVNNQADFQRDKRRSEMQNKDDNAESDKLKEIEGR